MITRFKQLLVMFGLVIVCTFTSAKIYGLSGSIVNFFSMLDTIHRREFPIEYVSEKITLKNIYNDMYVEDEYLGVTFDDIIRDDHIRVESFYPEDIHVSNFQEISVSAYSMGRFTASGRKVKQGMVALSHDLLRKYKYGTIITLYYEDRYGNIKRYGTYVVEDKMHSRWKNTCDIYMNTRSECFKFGRKKMWMSVDN
jgi:3D (Asp-Asp-Asp) domain-containing protein